MLALIVLALIVVAAVASVIALRRRRPGKLSAALLSVTIALLLVWLVDLVLVGTDFGTPTGLSTAHRQTARRCRSSSE